MQGIADAAGEVADAGRVADAAGEVAGDKGGKNIDETGYRMRQSGIRMAGSRLKMAVPSTWRSAGRGMAHLTAFLAHVRHADHHGRVRAVRNRIWRQAAAVLRPVLREFVRRARRQASRRHTTGCSCCTTRPRTDPDDDRRANRDAFTGRVLAVADVCVAYGEEKLAGKLRRTAAPRLFTFLLYLDAPDQQPAGGCCARW